MRGARSAMSLLLLLLASCTIPDPTTTTTTTSTTTTTRRSTSTTTTTRATTTTTSRTTSTSTTTSSSTAATLLAFQAPCADGYLGFDDPSTIPLWPQRMMLMLGEANAQGPLIATAKQVAASAGNTKAKFIFYQSLTDMDSRCLCNDQWCFDSWQTVPPACILRALRRQCCWARPAM